MQKSSFKGWFQRPVTHLGAKFRYNGGGVIDSLGIWADREKKTFSSWKRLNNDTKNLGLSCNHSILKNTYVNGLLKSKLWGCELATLDDNLLGHSVFKNAEKMYNSALKMPFSWSKQPKFDEIPDFFFFQSSPVSPLWQNS